MAKTAKVNPWVYDGDEFLARDTILGDLGGSTWTANTPYVLTSGVATPVASTTTTGIKGIFLEDHLATSTDADVKVARITGRVRWAGYISADDADAAESTAVVGTDYGIHVGNNADSKLTTTINTSDEVNPVLIIENVMSDRNSLEYATTTSPGVAIYRYIQSVIDG